MNLNPIAVFSVIQVPFPRTENWLFVDLIFKSSPDGEKAGQIPDRERESWELISKAVDLPIRMMAEWKRFFFGEFP